MSAQSATENPRYTTVLQAPRCQAVQVGLPAPCIVFQKMDLGSLVLVHKLLTHLRAYLESRLGNGRTVHSC